ncbi:MAG: hypothetical protein ACR2OC_08385 [Solirubrobacterales bacterium]
MGRGERSETLGTAEARKSLPDLVRKAVGHEKPARSPKRHAVEIQPRGEERSASLVPTIDLDAAEERIAGLEEELENAGIALFLHERMGGTGGDRLSAAKFLEGIGMDEFVDELPRR